MTHSIRGLTIYLRHSITQWMWACDLPGERHWHGPFGTQVSAIADAERVTDPWRRPLPDATGTPQAADHRSTHEHRRIDWSRQGPSIDGRHYPGHYRT